MKHQIDASFRQQKQSFAAWRRKARLRRIYMTVAAIGVLLAAAMAYLVRDQWMPRSDLDEELQLVEDMDDLPADAPVYVPAIVDLPGDPMWITLSHDPTAIARNKVIDRPADLADSGVPAKLEVLSDEMLSSSERFMTTIPSNQEDFAFFQAQRGGGAPASTGGEDEEEPALELEEPIAGQDATPADDVDGGWDQLTPTQGGSLPEFKKTEIENNTTVGTVVEEAQRFESTEDTFVRILGNRTLESVVVEARFSSEDAAAAAVAMKSVLGRDQIEQGVVVAMRGYRPSRGVPILSLMQLSIYAKSTYVGTLVRGGSGVFQLGVDPWVANDLFNYSGPAEQDALRRQYRLLDAIYSTAVRNNVPASVIGEAIMHLSRGNDLNLFASESDRLELVYSQESRGKAGSRVLYVAVQGTDRKLECYVFQQADGEFSCATDSDQIQSAAVSSGMTTPVNGVLTSTFGPRKHPILNVVRLHKGVDWKAPVGSPIFAAFDGQIIFRGDAGGYGNRVGMSHAGGRETRYAHMQRFADGIVVGMNVKAGTVIGYIGTTGLSTGPHLHFEVYQNGSPIDPLGTVMVASVTPPVSVPDVGTAKTSTSDAEAIQILTNRIIHVESGGSAVAKNPNSSATGLGQFISKTWIRMMNTYRSDLARSLSTTELLALRFDPTISRQMVENLAREGEAYLKNRGHAITAGRLYLCHFLGMEGAHLVLSAPRTDPLIGIIGAQAISANRFLTGKDANYVIDWAERKMRGAKGTAPVSAPQQPSAPIEVRQISPEFQKYKLSIGQIVKALGDGT